MRWLATSRWRCIPPPLASRFWLPVRPRDRLTAPAGPRPALRRLADDRDATRPRRAAQRRAPRRTAQVNRLEVTYQRRASPPSTPKQAVTILKAKRLPPFNARTY
ncbi:hypothetical protein GCM10023178_05360 [Actinomadura luteofluorescens]